MKNRLVIGIMFAGLVTTPAVAHEDGVYESLGHIPIGRIFLSPEDRARLDKVRGKAPVPSTTARSTGNASARTYDKDAAGFIVSDSGTTRVWKNGDFVATASASDVRFPGQVRVASQSAPHASDADADDEESGEPSIEAGDERE